VVKHTRSVLDILYQIVSANASSDVNFWSTIPSNQVPLAANARLRFLAVVDVAKIPLYLVAGPSLEVSTDNDETSNWLNGILLAEDPYRTDEGEQVVSWWERPEKQSDCGVLLKVDGEFDRKKNGRHATEILLVAAAKTRDATLPTPPASSSPAPVDQPVPETGDRIDVTLELYALPLCSAIIEQAKQASGLCSPPPEDDTSQIKARFLPDLASMEEQIAKRRKMSSLFEDATKKKRQTRARGKDVVPQATASLNRSNSLRGIPSGLSVDGKDASIDHGLTHSRKGSLSRAATVGSFGSLDSQRPTSRSGALANGKRSSLHRVESALSPCEGSLASESDAGFTGQNKTALTKVVMAGMRLHGLQQKKKPSRGLTKSPGTASMTGVETALDGDDEYKLVYHQTFKAAMFTFRAFFSTKILGQETMRDVVDRLLAIFCTDPTILASQNPGFGQSFTSSQPEAANTFDLPSSSAPGTSLGNGWSTPKTKRRRIDAG